MEYVKGTKISLKHSTSHDEAWLQTLISEDPSLLGLGDLVVKDLERKQIAGGRLDMLLADPEGEVRYEVEIQLGATDESHIIRTLEYWDVERRLRPQYEHIAVIVAEEVTSRFHNVIGLFNKAIPLIAIQITALEVEGKLTLSATKVLDLALSATEDEEEVAPTVDRAYWLDKAGEGAVRVVENLLPVINTVGEEMQLNFTRGYIGLARAGATRVGRSRNYVQFVPGKKAVTMYVGIPDPTDELDLLVERTELDATYNKRRKRVFIRFDIPKNGAPPMPLSGDAEQDLKELIRIAKGLPADPLDSRTDPYKTSSAEDHAAWQELEVEAER
ncbi:hypothetical protein [Kocuria flava]|uniref:hypothetical protein n=1 Tax=Kocuria flava TaxID=446860 RepID=UPI0015DE0DA0|nr:hypothetical protein [Kocuria flava]